MIDSTDLIRSIVLCVVMVDLGLFVLSNLKDLLRSMLNHEGPR